jgi:hypothetical protein
VNYVGHPVAAFCFLELLYLLSRDQMYVCDGKLPWPAERLITALNEICLFALPLGFSFHRLGAWLIPNLLFSEKLVSLLRKSSLSIPWLEKDR